MKGDPYCSVDGCHDVRTTFYCWTGTGNGWGIQRILTGCGGRYADTDVALCRIHALQKYRGAIGHRQFAYISVARLERSVPSPLRDSA